MTLLKSTLIMVLLTMTQLAIAQTPVEIMKDFYKVADARPFNGDKLKAFYSEDYTDHDNHSGQPSSSEAAIELFEMLASAAPDSVHEISFIEPVGKDKALVRWKFKGTQTGPLFGIPASNNTFDIAGMELWHIKDGKIVGIWHVEELMQLVEQISPSDK